MLKNMKVKNSLLLGYRITIGVSLLLIVASLFMMVNIKNSYNKLLDEDAQANQYILYCRVNSLLTGRNIRDAYLVLRQTKICFGLQKKHRIAYLQI